LLLLINRIGQCWRATRAVYDVLYSGKRLVFIPAILLLFYAQGKTKAINSGGLGQSPKVLNYFHLLLTFNSWSCITAYAFVFVTFYYTSFCFLRSLNNPWHVSKAYLNFSHELESQKNFELLPLFIVLPICHSFVHRGGRSPWGFFSGKSQLARRTSYARAVAQTGDLPTKKVYPGLLVSGPSERSPSRICLTTLPGKFIKTY